MGGTPTLNDSLPPKHRQFSLEGVEDHYLEWLEKWIAEIEGPPDTCRGRYRSIRGSPVLKTGSGESRSWVRIPLPPPASPQFSGFSSSLRKNARIWPGSDTPGPPENRYRRGSNASFRHFSLFALLAVDSACRWT
jgi:hypothetical protein